MKKFMGFILSLMMVIGNLSSVNAKPLTKRTSSKGKDVILYVDSTIKNKKTLKLKKAKWSTSDKKVVHVNKGQVKALKKGNVIVTAKTNKKIVKWKVTVKKVRLNTKKITLAVGQKKTLKLEGEKIQSARSNNKKIASVSQKGVVKAKKAGTCKILIKAKNKKQYEAAVKVKKRNNKKVKTTAEIAASYKYKIKPVLSPFCEYYLVETNYPKIHNIQFTGKNKDGKEVHLSLDNYTYADIDYYNESALQVKKNTYLFSQDSAYPMTTPMTLEVTDEKYRPETTTDMDGYVISYSEDRKFEKTTKTMAYPSGTESDVDYLIHTYADPVNGSFFDKMDAVQGAINDLAVYPKDLSDPSKGQKRYPALAASPYKELGLNEHIDVYPGSDKLLFSEYIYPYVLDSLDTPSMLATVAKVLEPHCKISGGPTHYLLDITLNGQTKTYGGAGEGSTFDMYINIVKKDYRFDGHDLLAGGLKAIHDQYLAYGDASDQSQKKFMDSLSKETIAQVVGKGAWIRIACEGSNEHEISYQLTLDDKAKTMSDCWVDGHYINDHEYVETGAKFEDHPKSDIVLRNQTYTDSEGKQVTGDLWYTYFEEKNTWIAIYNYNNAMWWTDDMLDEAPKLSNDDLEKVKEQIVKNTNKKPAAQFIYDGSAAPGTPV